MPPSYLRHPHLHGDTLVFVAEDDVWTAPVGSGRAYRLTADDVPAARPRISSDGTSVAWTSWRESAPEVFVTALDGGSARRLTWWGDRTTRVLGWSPDGDVLVVSAAGQPSRRSPWAYAIPATGGTPRRLPLGRLGDLAMRAGGPTVLLSALALEMAWQKRYRGGTAGKLWLAADPEGEFTRLVPDLDANLDSPMLVGERIAFLSDHEGWGNLYSVGVDGTGLRRHTDHGGEGAPAFYVRHAATDGTRVVYESAGQLYLLPGLDAAPEPIEVRLGGPRTDRDPYRITTGFWLDDIASDTTGRSSIVTVRGTVHRLTHRDGPSRTLLARPGVRARLAAPLGDDRAVWVDDALGEDAVCVAPLDPRAPDAPAEQRFGAGEIGRVLELVPAPDGETVALTTHDGRLLVLDVEDGDDGELREVARGGDGEIYDVAFSPDSAWMAYCDPVGSGRSQVMLVGPEGDPVAVTEGRFRDADPVFTLDGKHLAFLSQRSFDPIYDEHAFDLTFPAAWRPFLVPLGARTPSPFGASPDGRPVSPEDDRPEDPPALTPADPGDETSESPDPAPDAEGDDDGPPEVVVDVEGLAARVVPIPVVEGRYHGMSAAKDCLLWFRRPISGVLGDGRAGTEVAPEKPVLERFDLARRKLDVIAEPVSAYSMSGDGTRLVVRDGAKLRMLRVDRSAGPSGGAPTDGPVDAGADEYPIDTRRIVVTIDPAVEWRQMYDEAARLMRDHFWVADMSGVDWAAEVARYRSLVDAVGSHDDLVDLLWELQGELGTSHAYVTGFGGGGRDGRPGLLGADLEAVDDGWRVVRVLPPETSDPAARSPLSSPGVDVRAGDVIVEVGGQPVDPVLGPAPLLVGRGGELVELTVRSGEEVRRVVVRPLKSDVALRYQDWVAGRRAAVAERSGGRLGYLHVPDMMSQGWAQLHRDLSRETAREGLVLDVRGNAGGHTSQLVIEKLARRVIGWDIVRHGQPLTYPADAPRGPIVTLADEFSASDGDIVTAAIKRLGLGPVVGTRTWGGVIGIDGRYSLVDGTHVTQPRYAFWFDNLYWNVENHGVDPDVEVEITPQDWAAGRDPQLERAVDLALEALSARPAVTPPDPATRPSRARPPLPPRP